MDIYWSCQAASSKQTRGGGGVLLVVEKHWGSPCFRRLEACGEAGWIHRKETYQVLENARTPFFRQEVPGQTAKCRSIESVLGKCHCTGQPSLGNHLLVLWGSRASSTVWSNRAILCSYIYSNVAESIIPIFHLSTGWCRALANLIDFHKHWRHSVCCSSSHPKKISG